MRCLCIGLRTSGPRVYENTLVDFCAMVIDSGEVVDEFYALIQPPPYGSYRPALLGAYGLTLEELQQNGRNNPEVVVEFTEWLEPYRNLTAFAVDPPEFEFLTRLLQVSQVTLTPAILNEVWNVARALNCRNDQDLALPSRNETESIINWITEHPCEWLTATARERAILVNTCAESLIGMIKRRARGNQPEPEEKPIEATEAPEKRPRKRSQPHVTRLNPGESPLLAGVKNA